MFVVVRDETPTGRSLGQVTLALPGSITLRELIRLRVREEVARHNAAVGAAGPPSDWADWEEQADATLRAFAGNGFLVLVGHRQVEELDVELELSEASDVAFVRLVPLAGG